MKVVVLGAAGMLGKAVVAACRERGMTTAAYPRRLADVLNITQLVDVFQIEQPRIVINCAGTPNQDSLVNSLGPWNVSRAFSCKVWNISTDCVFDHRKSYPHHSRETVNPQTPYGISKATGEITAPHVSNIRTSFIGYEHGLLRWFLDQPKNAEIYGWTEATWSGSTVWEVAKQLSMAAADGADGPRAIEHLASKDWISKYDLLVILRTRFQREDITIHAVNEPKVNRAMYPTWSMEHVQYAVAKIPSLGVLAR